MVVVLMLLYDILICSRFLLFFESSAEHSKVEEVGFLLEIAVIGVRFFLFFILSATVHVRLVLIPRLVRLILVLVGASIEALRVFLSNLMLLLVSCGAKCHLSVVRVMVCESSCGDLLILGILLFEIGHRF